MVKRRTAVLVMLAALVAVVAGCGGFKRQHRAKVGARGSGVRPGRGRMWWWGDLQTITDMKDFVADSVAKYEGQPTRTSRSTRCSS